MSDAAEERAGAEPVQVDVSISVLVSDPEALRGYARSRYAACWFDAEWSPQSLAEAVLEALVLSNENPSPVDFGIEILESKASEAPVDAGSPRRLLGTRPARKGAGER